MKRALVILNLAVAAAGFAPGAGAFAQESPGQTEAEPGLAPTAERPADLPAEPGGTVAPGGGRAAQLLADLARESNTGWRRTERQLVEEWSKSGSSAMDLLLKRGRDAIEAAEYPVAIGHLTALTDHAPDFAEGFYARATAYFHANRYGPAVQDLERALQLNPQHYGALAAIALILEETGRKPAALAAFRAALAIHPRQDTVTKAVRRLENELSGRKI